MGEERIKVLPDALVNLIAAGEIIERPASVVKELVENALDAEASSVDIEVLVGGKKRIVVVDDGIGMSGPDAARSLLRHATSKIHDKGDLKTIHTLGFRGEALPSIASVSRFTLFTRERDADVGTEIRIEAGVTKDVRDAGVPPGTRVIVEDLFFSVPARRKFLKSDKTEYFNVLDVTAKSALARPDVRFRLVVDGREVINAVAGDLRSRAGDIVGKRIARGMGEVNAEIDGVRVTGLAAAPDQTRSTQSNIHLFVNDRPVRDFGVASAVTRAYAGLIMKDRFPIAILFVQVPFEEVDVNIHPTKREVKFADPRRVAGVVGRAVREALGGLTRVTVGLARADGPSYGRTAGDAAGAVVGEVGRLYFGDAGAAGAGGVTAPPPAAVPPHGVSPVSPREMPPADTPSPVADGPPGKRLLGQIAGTYIVLADDRGLVLIDQHAAHERVVYERIREGYRARSIPTQRLLFPIPLELSAPDRETIERHLDAINEVGVELERFGGNTLIVSAVPSAVKDADVGELVMGMVDELREGTAPRGLEETIDRLIKGIACHGAIRAGRTLGEAEIRMLIAEIERTPDAAHCPHGRPTMVRIEAEEIARRFKRS
jgi:DNA mismatch repair protein MutL